MENQMSLIKIALEIMDEHKEPIDIYTLIEETLARKGVVDTDGTYAAKLYTDITTSSKFVFMGENKWDLKSRQSLDQFDKDGSSFNSKDDYDNAEEEDDESYDDNDDEEKYNKYMDDYEDLYED